MRFSANDLHRFGMQKLAQLEGVALPYSTDSFSAESSYPTQSPVTVIIASPPAPPEKTESPKPQKTMLPFAPTAGITRAPTPLEAHEMDSYSKAGLLGLLGGSAAGLLAGMVLPGKQMIRHGLLGAGAGLLGGIGRHYEQSSEPPGLSPVYTIPGGIRTGGALGAIGGGLGAHFLPMGMKLVPGILSGAASGAIGGALASQMI